jgi:hypothetical protein
MLRLYRLGLGLLCAAVGGLSLLSASALAGEGCPNEALRVGPSASLPDCRAYELVTPEDLGRTQDLAFTEGDYATPSADGEHLALSTFTPLEPESSSGGARVVFSRTVQGWTMRSVVMPGDSARILEFANDRGILSPDLSQVAFESFIILNNETESQASRAFEVGPVGGPYTLVADVPGGHEYETRFAGANSGTASVPALSDVVFESTDHQLLPPGPEREAAEEIAEGRFEADVYEWTEGKLRLVNVEGEGSNVRLVNKCPADLGSYAPGIGGETTDSAVSADGSKIFFTNCNGLYMRVDGRETVEVSRPAPGMVLNPAERTPVRFDAATPDGSEVVFNTETPLLAGETSIENRLFMYDTETGVLSLIKGTGAPSANGTEHRFVLLSEDGSTVYYNANETIYRYETRTGKSSFVAKIGTPIGFDEQSYVTPDGRFLVFVAGGRVNENTGVLEDGVEGEPRGAGHNELYRYDAAAGSVMCVSCGEGAAPAEGEMIEFHGVFEDRDGTPPFVQMSDDGQRVFFQTTAQLVPQDTNSVGGFPFYSGMDVYEWEADGVEESPDVFCRVAVGCTHLLSSGEDVGAAHFLGASSDGSNVFFASASQLVPQATPEFSNIYDARVDGGFAPPEHVAECLSCQGVGSPPPLFNTPASATFTGTGNPVAPASKIVAKPKKKAAKKKAKRKARRRRGKKTKGRAGAAGRSGGRARANRGGK